MRHVVFDLGLKKQKHRNKDQEQSDSEPDKAVDAISMNLTEVGEEGHPENGSGNAANGQREDDLSEKIAACAARGILRSVQTICPPCEPVHIVPGAAMACSMHRGPRVDHSN